MDREPDVAAAARDLADSLARLKQAAADYGRERLDDLRGSVEAQLRRRLWMLAGGCFLLVLLAQALLFAGVAIIMAFRATHPALAAASVAAGWLVVAGVLAWLIARAGRRRPQVESWLFGLLGLLATWRQLAR